MPLSSSCIGDCQVDKYVNFSVKVDKQVKFSRSKSNNQLSDNQFSKSNTQLSQTRARFQGHRGTFLPCRRAPQRQGRVCALNNTQAMLQTRKGHAPHNRCTFLPCRRALQLQTLLHPWFIVYGLAFRVSCLKFRVSWYRFRGLGFPGVSRSAECKL